MKLYHIRNQHTCLPLLTLGSKPQGSSLISTNLFTLLYNNNKYSYEKFLNAKFRISTHVYQ